MIKYLRFFFSYSLLLTVNSIECPLTHHIEIKTLKTYFLYMIRKKRYNLYVGCISFYNNSQYELEISELFIVEELPHCYHIKYDVDIPLLPQLLYMMRMSVHIHQFLSREIFKIIVKYIANKAT